jgi:nicotinamidase/pyrazinamidase
VARGDEVVEPLNRLIERFSRAGLPIFATRDWHPERTSHFRDYGGVWPAHCVQGTKGAEFHPDLKLNENVVTLSKGMAADEDSYSGFQAVDQNGTPLAELLRRAGVERIFVGGLATDYCVKQTVLDGLKQGFQVVLLDRAMRAVDLNPGDGDRAIAEMIQAGAAKAVDFEKIPA